MSIRVISAAMEIPPAAVTPTQRLVLLVLAWHADEHGRNAWPAIPTIARKTSLTRRSVQRLLLQLKDKGFIAETGRAARGSIRYALNLGHTDCDTVSQSAPIDCDTVSRGGDTPSQRGRHSVAEGATQCRPIRPLTVRDPSEKKTPLARRVSSASPNSQNQDHEERHRQILDNDARARLVAEEAFTRLTPDARDHLERDARATLQDYLERLPAAKGADLIRRHVILALQDRGTRQTFNVLEDPGREPGTVKPGNPQFGHDGHIGKTSSNGVTRFQAGAVLAAPALAAQGGR